MLSHSVIPNSLRPHINPFAPPGALPDPGFEGSFLVSPALAGGFFVTEPPGKPHHQSWKY